MQRLLMGGLVLWIAATGCNNTNLARVPSEPTARDTPRPDPSPDSTPIPDAPETADCFSLMGRALTGIDSRTGEWGIAERYEYQGVIAWREGFSLTDTEIVSAAFLDEENGGDVWLRYDRQTGVATTGPEWTRCDPLRTVAGGNGDLYSFCLNGSPHFQVCRYEDFAGLAAEQSLGVVGELPFVTRFNVKGDLLYGAYFVTDTVDVVDMVTGAVSHIPLSGFDDDVQGLSVRGSELYILAREEFLVFDLETGTQLRRFSLGTGHQRQKGLNCPEREAAEE